MPRPLTDIVAALERLAPPGLADDWDNVGLLVDGPPRRPVRRCLLTVDLTEAVLDEAIERGSGLIVSYHPPIFAPLKRLRAAVVKERLILRAIQARIAIHSPHTALDAAPGGVNDWLADGLGPLAGRRSLAGAERSHGTFGLEARLPRAAGEALAAELRALGLEPAVEDLPAAVLVRVAFDGDGPRRVIGALPPELRARCELVRRAPALSVHSGQGREVLLRRPARLETLVRRIKQHLGLPAVRVATHPRHRDGTPIERVLVCAGAGGSVLAPHPADLYWTGEMRHHDVLAALERGTSVVLCEHTNTERGYLPVLRERLDEALDGDVFFDISRSDAEPLQYR
jgi:dinuclear metal center YbgI/SA1388 family protein